MAGKPSNYAKALVTSYGLAYGRLGKVMAKNGDVEASADLVVSHQELLLGYIAKLEAIRRQKK